MRTLESRIENLETEWERMSPNPMSDAELAVRMYWLNSQGGPSADRMLSLLAAVDARLDDHAQP